MLCRYPRFLEAASSLVACGRCHHCRINSKQKKIGRILLESQTYDPSQVLFVTLTYGKHRETGLSTLPLSWTDKKTGQVFENLDTGTLDPADTRNFMKRLRKLVQPQKLRYFATGEYGEKKQRPHYHFCLFGLDFKDRDYIYRAWKLSDIDRIDVQVPRSTHDVAQYCAGYIMKRMNGTHPDLNYRYPEFSRFSKGIGLSALEFLEDAYHSEAGLNYIRKHNDVLPVFVLNGKTYPIDRYMKEKLRASLDITESAKFYAKQKAEAQMLELQARAQASGDAFHDFDDKQRRAWLLENRQVLETQTKLNTTETAFQLFNKSGEF